MSKKILTDLNLSGHKLVNATLEGAHQNMVVGFDNNGNMTAVLPDAPSQYDDTALSGRVTAVEAVIPSTASSSNKVVVEDSLADVATSGSYSDLSNKPDLTIYAQSSNLADVATSGEYADLNNRPDLTVFVQKSQTEGLLKNDGTVDTNEYITEEALPTKLSELENDDMYVKMCEGHQIEGYRQLKYIESTGTQYIDLGVIPNLYTGFEIDFTPLDTVTANDAPNILNAGGRGTALHYGITMYGNNKLKGAVTIGNSGDINANLTQGSRMVIKYMSNGSQVLTINNGTETVVTATNVNVTNSLYLFCAHPTTGSLERFAHCKIYSLKLYDHQTLTHYFVPMIRLSDNEIGLYDIVTDVFYVNGGTGVFKYDDNLTGIRFTDIIMDTDQNVDKYKSAIQGLQAMMPDVPTNGQGKYVLTYDADNGTFAWEQSGAYLPDSVI